jgi:ketosteroid isomerase-like protein
VDILRRTFDTLLPCYPFGMLACKEVDMTTMDIARKLVELCRQGKNEEALDTLYADDAVSVEAMAMPDAPPEVKGLAAIKAKGEWWMNNHEIHSSSVTGPWPHGDRFIVGFQFDVTNKPSGRRIKMEEAGLYHVRDGKIVREEFFYDMGT